MRFLIAATSLSALALTTGAFAQTTPQPPPAAQTTERESIRSGSRKRIPYKPCPGSVVFYPQKRHGCLGCPAACRGWNGDASARR